MRFNPFLKGDRCSLCGNEHPSAVYNGHAQVFCCSHCAMHVLPTLMTDAMAEHIRQLRQAQCDLEIFVKRMRANAGQ